MCARLYFIYFFIHKWWFRWRWCVRIHLIKWLKMYTPLSAESKISVRMNFKYIIIICCNQIFAYLISFRFAPCTMIVPLYFMPMFNIEMHFNDGPKRLSMRDFVRKFNFSVIATTLHCERASKRAHLSVI